MYNAIGQKALPLCTLIYEKNAIILLDTQHCSWVLQKTYYQLQRLLSSSVIYKGPFVLSFWEKMA